MSVNLNHAIQFREVGKEGVVYDMHRRKIYVLNPTAAFIWRLRSKTTNLNEVAREVSEHFRVPIDQVQADVEAIIKIFSDLSLVE